MNRSARFLKLSFVVLFAVWCVLSFRADLAKVSLTPLRQSWNIVLFATLLSLLNYVLRIFRWRWYLRRLGHSLTIEFAALTYIAGFAFTLSPGKIGEVARARYYSSIGISLRDVTAAFVAERLTDLLAMLIMATLILTVFPGYRVAVVSAAVIISVAFLLLGALRWDRIAASREISNRFSNILSRLSAKAGGALMNTRTLLRPSAAILGLTIGLLAWALEGVGLGVLCKMSPTADITITVAVGIYAIAVLVGALSFLPGGLGSTEAVMTALLVARGFSLADAILITLTCRMVTLWLAVCLGWLSVLRLRTVEMAR